jgi:hypothetical protein
VTTRVLTACHELTQLRMSSCHQVSHGVEQSSSVEMVEARFKAGLGGWGQSVDGRGSRCA